MYQLAHRVSNCADRHEMLMDLREIERRRENNPSSANLQDKEIALHSQLRTHDSKCPKCQTETDVTYDGYWPR